MSILSVVFAWAFVATTITLLVVLLTRKIQRKLYRYLWVISLVLLCIATFISTLWLLKEITRQHQATTAVEVSDTANWRAEVLTKYLNHEQVPRKDMWWLDISSGLVHQEPYITIFCEAEGISVSDYDPVVLWRERMYPRLYQDFVGWLPPPER
ncbi:MAG: hypothetical protein WC518_01080 [Patescibacteria group bacterium]